MEKDHSPIHILAIYFLALLTIVSGCTNDFEPHMFHNISQYSIAIQSNGPIENATFIIPLPVKNGNPTIGPAILEKNDFIQENISIEFTKTPPGLNLSDAETLVGYDPCFVVIHADKLVSADPGTYATIYHFEKKVNNPMGTFNGFINTRNPIGNEPLITPKFNFTWQEPQVGKIDTTHIRYNPQKIPQITMIYSNYQASPSTHVGIFFALQGSNEWNEGFDEWKMNSYRDSFSRTFYGGSQAGWFFTDGDLELLYGIYPNTTHSAWRLILNQTTT
jgi:hypothetical protein